MKISKAIIPFKLHQPVINQFQTLLTYLSAYFSTFPHGTKYAIGLRVYLVLGVNDTHIHTGNPTGITPRV